jgi:hypothetical protein
MKLSRNINEHVDITIEREDVCIRALQYTIVHLVITCPITIREEIRNNYETVRKLFYYKNIFKLSYNDIEFC